MFKNIKKNLLTLHCPSKAQKKELLKHLKLDTIKALCEYTIINGNIKVSDQEKRKSNRKCDKIREFVNPKTLQKKRKEIRNFSILEILLAPIFGSLVGPLLKDITAG